MKKYRKEKEINLKKISKKTETTVAKHCN